MEGSKIKAKEENKQKGKIMINVHTEDNKRECEVDRAILER